jgi:diguanylate cyclase (GGDEF)-like protein
VGGFVANSRDVTYRKQMEAQLWHQAHHDSLTGLPNRALFTHRVQRALDERGWGSVAVIFLDLDGFKVINDSLGHEYGDRLLIAVADRFRSCLRAGSLIARLGGDEFTVMLEGMGDVREAVDLCDRLQGVLAHPFSLQGNDVIVSASSGIVVRSPELATPTDLLRAADVALYRAKSSGKGSRAVFDATQDAAGLARLRRETELRHAVERGELRLHYQPTIDLRNGRIVGVEALVRWEHPTAGLLPPSEFIGMAEETGLIRPLGAWVLAEGCRQVMEWHERFPTLGMLELSVNVSPIQVHHPDLVEQVRQVLGETGLAPECLVLEITERGLVDATGVTDRTVAGLVELGARLGIDDYGAYQAGLGYLRRWPMNVIKLDRMLVTELNRNERSRAIVAAVSALATSLGMRVIGEGIESVEQLTKVRELGCAWGQGFLFAPPQSPQALAADLERGTTFRVC